MKFIVSISLIFFCSTTHSQIELNFEDGKQLRILVSEFVPQNHVIDSCVMKTYTERYCLIDGKPWFGGFFGMKLPSYQIDQIIYADGVKEVLLDVSSMFDPAIVKLLINEILKSFHIGMEQS